MKNFFLCLGATSILLSGCASSSRNISASYVSPLQYQGYNCNQIRMEIQRVGRKVSEIAGKQDSEATKDKVAMGVGLVLFWPALFFLIGDDKKEELARLKGEYEALEGAAIEKECNIAQAIENTRKLEEERKEKQKVSYKKQGHNE